jgi:putative tryptophan/tyrosine transport system substrate-binding protein
MSVNFAAMHNAVFPANGVIGCNLRIEGSMRRREFITLLGAVAAPWPLAAQAQPPAMPVIGFLSSVSADAYGQYMDAFRRGLNETGYVEGRNVAIEYRWARGRYDRLPALATELVSRQVAVLVAVGGDPSALAAKAATSTIPIVFSSTDPVKSGLVTSLNRPDGNATGFNVIITDLEPKRLGLLHELFPGAALFGALLNPVWRPAAEQRLELAEAARKIGRPIVLLNASTEAEIDAAFASLVQQSVGALVITSDPFIASRHDQIIALAARYAMPTIYPLREFAAAGGLMSYGPSITESYHQVGIYAAKILNGAKPADLPVMQSVKFELVINLKTAKTLGFEFPPTFSARADEVIE